MSVNSVKLPYEVFFNSSGTPLENGKIYIGEANQNPETNAVSIYWDDGFTQAAAQPLRTINGYLSRQGSPGEIFVSGDFSITVRDKNDNLIYSKLTNEAGSDEKSFSVSAGTGGTTVKTISLANNSSAMIEVYGAGLKGSNMAINKVVFSIFRTTGTMTITNADDGFSDGTDYGVYFDIVQSGNDGILKAYTDSGSWEVSGSVRILSGNTVSLS